MSSSGFGDGPCDCRVETIGQAVRETYRFLRPCHAVANLEHTEGKIALSKIEMVTNMVFPRDFQTPSPVPQ